MCGLGFLGIFAIGFVIMLMLTVFAANRLYFGKACRNLLARKENTSRKNIDKTK